MNQQARYWVVLGSIAAIVLVIAAISTNGSLLTASLNGTTVINDDPVTPNEVIECNKKRAQCVTNARARYEKCMETAGSRYAACIVEVDRAVKNERDKKKKEEIKKEGYQKCAEGLAKDSAACNETLKTELDKCQKDFEVCLKAAKPDPKPAEDEDDENDILPLP